MNDRGFTLIEIIAIMVVLVGIFLIVFPSFMSMAKSEEDKKYSNMVNDLCIAGKTYMYSNLDEFPNLSIANSVIELKINELIAYGNVNEGLKNPKTNESVENDTLKYTVLEDFTLDCEYIEE